MLIVERVMERGSDDDAHRPCRFGRWIARYVWNARGDFHQWTAVDSDPLVAAAMAIEQSALQMAAVAQADAERARGKASGKTKRKAATA
mgnify:CR=1 FL=1